MHTLFTLRGSATQERPNIFPRFSELPPELRDQIWVASLEHRIIPLHLRQYHHNRSDIEIYAQRNTGSEASTHVNNGRTQYNEQRGVMTYSVDNGEDENHDQSIDGAADEVEPVGSDNDDGIDERHRFYTMAILTCNTEGSCKCTYAPPSKLGCSL